MPSSTVAIEMHNTSYKCVAYTYTCTYCPETSVIQKGDRKKIFINAELFINNHKS